MFISVADRDKRSIASIARDFARLGFDIVSTGGTAKTLAAAQIEQANNQAKLILSEAQQTADGILKQAEKLAQMRRAKVIADTEKKYDEAIAAVLRAVSE